MRVSDIDLGLVTASLVVSPSGDHVGSDGTSKTLGGQADLEWFIGLRNRVEVILTSGKTYRDENYKPPKKAQLAVFSAKHGSTDLLEGAVPIGPNQARDYEGAVQYLLTEGYGSIHCEFGPRGFIALAKAGFVECYLSCETTAGIRAFSERHSLGYTIAADEELVIARMGSVAVL